ncbi:helix-turn-helix domain-containing protein [Kitasatospora fiedleri]|uniref:helix-turn-helix domain-containing protein n=1 Tax=Kitasatospora fiedleri TaxID=2991545 RepID=UPI00249AC716|nr:helix-turn-helix transcriptional regulator [Kitasatospora fiedleri]
MARRPRPVDPADGPVPAFAHDLRLVRERAGNPTYRVLAERAGFGATTLSDAAGGVRLPSLEVTQAYVGACGGDVEEWTRRWNELDRELGRGAGTPSPSPAAENAADTTPAAAEKPTVEGATADDAPGSGSDSGSGSGDVVTGAVPLSGHPSAETVHDGRRPRWTTAGTAALLVLTVVLALVAARTSGFGRSRSATENALTSTVSAANATPNPNAADCPAATATPSTAVFSGTTYIESTRLRAGASLSADVVLQLPAGCRLQLTGFCLGDTVIDATSGSPDVRWFRTATGGYVSSAVIHGNPPADLQPTDCPDAVAPPASITLTVTPAPGSGQTPGRYELHATGDRLGIVGYAAYLPRTGSTSQWQQIGMSADASAGFPVPWQPGPPPDGTDPQTAVEMVAVACFGGEGPSSVADQRLVPRTATAPLQVAELGETELARARKAACRYPDTARG